MFVGEGEGPNELFDVDVKRPNASFGGGKKRSIASFVREGKRPNTTHKKE